MAQTLHPIKILPFDADAIRRQKGANRLAIAAATPEQHEAMQRAYSLVGYNRADLELDPSHISKSLLLAETGSMSVGEVAP